MKEQKTTITPEEAVQIMRANGISISTPTLRSGIEEGVLPIGYYIDGTRTWIISRKKFIEWIKEQFCDGEVVVCPPSN